MEVQILNVLKVKYRKTSLVRRGVEMLMMNYENKEDSESSTLNFTECIDITQESFSNNILASQLEDIVAKTA